MRNRLIRLFHTSDVHIGERDVGGAAAWEDQGRLCVQTLVDHTLAENVDLIIVAGDFFDHNGVSEILLQSVAEQLSRLPIPILMLPGNHDCLVPGAALNRLLESRAIPTLHVFADGKGATYHHPALDLAVWGKAHVGYGPDIFPLRGVPPRGSEQWQLAVAHGHLLSDSALTTGAYVITQNELAGCQRDYVCLGHWMRMTNVSVEGVPAWYSGSPIWEGSIALVELGDDSVRVARYALPAVLPRANSRFSRYV